MSVENLKTFETQNSEDDINNVENPEDEEEIPRL